ncbi:MAG TPA: FAD/NAD(P)-binding protein [Chloroflexota bacterium]|nr:FAD/NAD(P)-binding protein [Chloroflexota bacterium]
MLPEPWIVRSFRRETYDTFTLVLEPAGPRDPFLFAPGQFNMLYVFGVGEAPISICGDPATPELLVHTVRSVGPVTAAMARLRPGDMMGLRGPFGSSWPVEAARGRDVIIVAGGIGLPPLRPALYHVLAHREEYARISLLYGARTPLDILYPHEVERWRGRFDLDVQVTVDAADAAWRGNVGLVTTLISKAQFDPLDTTVMIVGPEIMMRFTVLDLVNRGVQESDIYISMERNMKCAIGFCGHCQFGPSFICNDGPVFSYDRLAPLLQKREV